MSTAILIILIIGTAAAVYWVLVGERLQRKLYRK